MGDRRGARHVPRTDHRSHAHIKTCGARTDAAAPWAHAWAVCLHAVVMGGGGMAGDFALPYKSSDIYMCEGGKRTPSLPALLRLLI